MINPNKLLSRKEAADFLGLKKNTLAVWAVQKKEDLPFFKVGGVVKYKKSDLEKFLENNTIFYKKNQKLKAKTKNKQFPFWK